MQTQERQAALDQLRASDERLMALVEKLTPAQWSFHPGEGRWSIADCIEHVTAVESRVFGAIRKRLEGPAGDPEKLKLTEGKDELVRRAIPDRANRIEAPEPVRPTGQWRGISELLAQYRATRERTIAFVEETGADLRSHSWPHIALGEMDCYQWILTLGHHGDRHAKQVDEIRRHPEFPAA
jgi:DinB family protein